MSLVTTALAGHADLASSPITDAPLTLAVWIKVTTLGGAYNFLTVGTSGSDNHRFTLGKSAADLFRGEEKDTVSSTSAVTLALTDTNLWHLGVATFIDHTTRPAFFDGQYKSSTTAARTAAGTNYTRLCGTPSGNGLTAGLIGCAAVWNVALNDSEVQQLYNRNPFGSMRAQNLVFYVPKMNGNVIDVVTGNGLALTSCNFSGEEPPLNYARNRYFWGIDAGVSGTTTAGQGSQTISGTGTETFTGTTATAQGSQTIAATGTETLTGTITTGQGSQTTADVGEETETGTASTGQGGQTIDAAGTSTGVTAYSGGFETAYERQLLERRRDREREAILADEAQAAAQGDEVQAELARFLHHQLALDSERIELERLRKLVAAHSQVAASSPAVLSAFDRAKATQSFSRLQALQRAYVRMMEEEESAVAMVLMTLD